MLKKSGRPCKIVIAHLTEYAIEELSQGRRSECWANCSWKPLFGYSLIQLSCTIIENIETLSKNTMVLTSFSHVEWCGVPRLYPEVCTPTKQNILGYWFTSSHLPSDLDHVQAGWTCLVQRLWQLWQLLLNTCWNLNCDTQAVQCDAVWLRGRAWHLAKLSVKSDQTSKSYQVFR